MNHLEARARGAPYTRLPLWRDSNPLLIEIEIAVRGFSRYHKYTIGTDLRRLAMEVVRRGGHLLCSRGGRDRKLGNRINRSNLPIAACLANRTICERWLRNAPEISFAVADPSFSPLSLG